MAEETRKRGRPPVEDTARHSAVISIRLTPGEIVKLDRYGEIKGLSRSQVIQKWLDMVILLDTKGG
jgi:hypothetical protein